MGFGGIRLIGFIVVRGMSGVFGAGVDVLLCFKRPE
jgi:hypothetical protein